METIPLPALVDDVAACAEYNRRLRAAQCELDWAGVTNITDAAAEALLRGLRVDHLPDELGAATMSEPVAARVLSLFAAPEPVTRTTKGKREPKKEATEGEEPGVWTAPDEPTKPRSTPPRPRLAPLPPRELRALLEERVLRDLLGPAAGPEEEVSESSVRDRYLVGLLAPRRLRIEPEQLDSLQTGAAAGEEDNGDEDEAPAAVTMFPSAIGLSFCVEPGTRVRITAGWGQYRRTESATLRDAQDRPRRVWRRTPMGGTLEPLELREGPIEPLVIDRAERDVTVRGVANRVGDVLVVSLFLVNGQNEPEELRDQAWLFQPEFRIEGEGGAPVFLARALPGRLGPIDDDDRAMTMLFRDRCELVVGHGVAVRAVPSASDPRRAVSVSTVVVPAYEVGAQRPRIPLRLGDPGHQPAPEEDARLAGLVLDMKVLAETPRAQVSAALSPLVVAYEAWIVDQEARLSSPDARLGDLVAVGAASLARCRKALGRIRAGIALLATDEQAHQAFAFANQAMWQQRAHGLLAERRRRGDVVTLADVDVPAERTWRTFQLAFLLLVLEGLTKLDHPDRVEPTEATADLLWFPTGGGKTEAYLGATAYVLALRRLQGEVGGRSGEHGVAVLMRYTLRLLTLQQFQRAATLICACEQLRREALASGDARWGQEPFRLGLWVGAKSTPNKTAHAAEALKQQKGTNAMQSSGMGRVGSPVQLKSCPWCGATIDPGRHLEVRTYPAGAGRTLMFCGDDRGMCLFSKRLAPDEGLPVVVVDEEIYRLLPSLLIATIDKFAQMPWKGEVGMLFGQVTGRCSRHGFRSPDLEDADSHPKKGATPAAQTHAHPLLRPPDLIIQDELHLISGPLGTLAGLYETAVDELCTWELHGKRVRPKVIASTATVRRASEQVHALFQRRVDVFPPQALDATDNFFSLERSVADLPGRRYLGICAQGRRLKAALLRVYVAFLAAGQQLYDEFGVHADPWMTTVGYFGSLRELAGMRRLVDDDVRTRVKRMHTRGLADRYIGEPKELTSRLGSTEIPTLLDLLEVPFDPEDEQRRKHGSKEQRMRRPIDVLLATNMISVGVDVKRLGLMICAGQPKTTAEYIQATSRVGRQHPGLVCTVYNWARPRDLSHYESFEHYHATFYKHVEALSVTPFAARALDRGLSALLVSLVRLSGPSLNPNEAAADVANSNALVTHAIDAIALRAARVEESQARGQEVRTLLKNRAQQWKAAATPAQGKAQLTYKKQKDGISRELLKPAGMGPWDLFTCLNSLRDVEPSVSLVLDDRGLDNDPGAGTSEGGSA